MSHLWLALDIAATDEDKPVMPTSIYALSKRHQEEMCLQIGRTYGPPVVALRYFNVFGSRQSLSNPYTGACTIFSSRILNNNPPYIFEDGKQLRDCIHVKDISCANLRALERSNPNYITINIGTGTFTSIYQLAETKRLTWYDIATWRKSLALIFFGSRTGEAISLGISMKVIYYSLIGVVLFLLGMFMLFRKRGK